MDGPVSSIRNLTDAVFWRTGTGEFEEVELASQFRRHPGMNSASATALGFQTPPELLVGVIPIHELLNASLYQR